MVKIGLFDIFKRKDPRCNHDMNDEDRENSANTRKLKLELKRAQHDHDLALENLRFEQKRLELQQSIQELRDDIEDYNGDYDEPGEQSTEDKLLTTLLTSILAKNQPGATITAAPEDLTPADGEPSDQELRRLWKKLPANYQAQAKELIK